MSSHNENVPFSLIHKVFFLSSVDFSGTGGDPKTEARPNGGNAVSYNVIDSQSPPYFVNTSRSMVSSLNCFCSLCVLCPECQMYYYPQILLIVGYQTNCPWFFLFLLVVINIFCLIINGTHFNLGAGKRV